MKIEKESKMMLEVRKWKREVAKKASNLHGQELADYYNESFRCAFRIID